MKISGCCDGCALARSLALVHWPGEKLTIIVDTETTGLDHRHDDVIELGMLAFIHDAVGAVVDVVGTFNALQEPARPISPDTTRLTGITDAMVEGQRIDRGGPGLGPVCPDRKAAPSRDPAAVRLARLRWRIAVQPCLGRAWPQPLRKVGKTPVLDPEEARTLLDAIDTGTPAGLRDRALIGFMVYSFARVNAALGMKVEDAFTQNRRLWVRLNEKGNKRHEIPCHHNLEAYLHAYIDGCGLGDDPKGPLFRTIGRGTRQLSAAGMAQPDTYAMICRRARAADIGTKVGNHTFRATGITAYLKNGGTLEKAAAMANHASTRTTQLYDRRRDEMSLDEIERIRI